ncbi:hypothetical protein E6R60_06410 [Streptomyces sp. A0642]|uniref:hypothetical protein n=1 Tax=Streptomyces sp. A0642 TaxID=2563100 RepID=UPI0010A25460|nr:hypothetical protein [Streptomyces sp. A0642]THA78498.1 hypothetical protein E6R60_06410 [Streptomyces sp. A0642]
MQRGLVHALAWSLATGAAVTLSWWGVHTVMAGTAYDPPRAVPIAAGARSERDVTENLSSSTHRPRPAPSKSPPASRRPAPKPSASPSRTPSRLPAATPRPTATATASGTARSYRTDGGRIVFELGTDAAKLVSATPEQGWSVQVWTNTTWIRVNFTKDDGTTVSVYCTWNDHPPMVEIVNS